jgi:phosphatidylinositol-3-phosphatase
MLAWRPNLALIAVPVLVGAACSSGTPRSAGPAAPVSPASRSATSSPAPASVRPSKIVLIVMENHAYDEIVGNPEAPFLNDTIVPRSLSLTDMHADGHPSLPNYVWMSAGDACGATSDGDWGRTCRSVYDQMLDAGVTWTAYAEGYPGGSQTCSLVDVSDPAARDYARKHNPPLLFASTSAGTPCTDHVRNFPGDTVADGGPPVASFPGVTLPSFTVVIPNQCHDMHDDAATCGAAGGGIAGGDRWLRENWASLLADAGPHGVVILTWDEPDGGDAPIPTFIAGPAIGGGTTDANRYDHASTLRAIEDAFGLPCLAATCDARPLPITGR